MRRFIGLALAAVFAAVGLAHPALASESGPDENYLDELQRIAGRSAAYQPYHDTDPRSAQPMATLDPFQCTLYPSVVHPRTSAGKKSVGAKPYTSCKTGRPTIISQTSTLYIVEWAGLRYKQVDRKTGTSRGVASLTQKNIEFHCKSNNTSRFQQETKGYSVQLARTYQSAVITPRVDLPCGH